MKNVLPFSIILLSIFLLCACGSDSAQPEATLPVEPVEQEQAVDMTTVIEKGGCGACHVIPGVASAVGAIGPDLSEMGPVAQAHLQSGEYSGEAALVEDFIFESLVSPDAFIPTDCPGGDCQAGLMPSNFSEVLTEQEIETITTYLASLPDGAVEIAGQQETALGEMPPLSEAEWTNATQIFFDRCAGCHGVLRKGATGPALTPDKTLEKGTLALSAIIFNGTPRGMPDWGKQGVLSEEQAELMAKFVQNEPPQPPEMSLEQMTGDLGGVRRAWTTGRRNRSTSAIGRTSFAVTLRDAGQVAIIDGDTYEVVNNVDTGYAVHISRMSATGRYVYTIGTGRQAGADRSVDGGAGQGGRGADLLRCPLGGGQQVCGRRRRLL